MRNKRKKITGKKLWDENFEKIRLDKSKKRAVIIRTIIFFCFSAIFIRLVVLMVFDHDMLSRKAEQQYLRTRTLKAQRGIIWDRAMRPLSINIETDSLYAVPSQVNNVKELSVKLASVIKVSAKKLNKKLLKNKDKSFMLLARKMDVDTANKVHKLKKNIHFKEIGILREAKRFYPNGHIASHVVGYTDIDNEGLGGIELQFNDYMKGSARKIYSGRDAR